MTRETEEKLARSLTAETTELIPFLPYLLQDFWALGSDPDNVAGLVKKHVGLSENTKILDLACGKGAVSVKIAQTLQVKVKGIDIMPAFTEVAEQKAREHNINDLCEFVVGDINEAVKNEKDYDGVIFAAAGNLLGGPAETLNKLKSTIKQGGHILIDADYIPDNGKQEDVKYNACRYFTEKQWAGLIEEAGLELIETVSGDSPDGDSGMALITARANELIEKYPDKKDMFMGYLSSQQNEYIDIKNSLVCVTLVLKKL